MNQVGNVIDFNDSFDHNPNIDEDPFKSPNERRSPVKYKENVLKIKKFDQPKYFENVQEMTSLTDLTEIDEFKDEINKNLMGALGKYKDKLV